MLLPAWMNVVVLFFFGTPPIDSLSPSAWRADGTKPME